jgi:hypothetical protein
MLALIAPSVVALAAGFALPSAASASAHGGAVATTSIALESQNPWLGQGANDVLEMAVRISSPDKPPQLSLSINVYPRLFSLSDFEQTVAGQPVGNVLDAPPPIPLTEFKGVDAAAPTAAALSLRLPVTAGYPSGGGPVTSPTLALDFSGDGVYPLQVSVVNAQFVVLSSFITFLVYAAPPSGSTPLRLGWVVPLGAGDSIDAGGHYHLSSTTTDMIEDVSAALAPNPSVRMSFALPGATAAALAPPSGKPPGPLMSDLVGLAADTSSFEFTRSTYVPVDVDEMSGDALTGELNQQLSQGAGALNQQLGVNTTRSPWVAWGPLDEQSVQDLESDGVSQFVLPAGDVSSFACTTAPTCTQPFGLANSDSTATPATPGPVVMAADPVLATDFGAAADPALDAQLLLANLAFIYFELPYDNIRGVVLENPSSWQPNLPFLKAFVSGLQSSPIVSTYTLSQLLTSVPLGGNGEARARSLAASQPAAPQQGGALPTGAIRQARSTVAAVSSVAPTLTKTPGTLNDLILSSEAEGLPSGTRLGILSLVGGVLSHLGSLISLPSGRTVTLTSSAGQVPLTITSRAGFPLHVVLALSNPQLALRFPHGERLPATGTLVLSRGNTSELISVASRTSGDFSLRIEVVSPTGAAMLAQGDITIRSTALSGVAISLSVGALLLLIIWWVRSSRRHRRDARDAARADEGEEAAGRGAPGHGADEDEPSRQPDSADPVTAGAATGETPGSPGEEHADGPPRSESPAPAGA